MQYSGIIVTVAPDAIPGMVERLNALPGLEVHRVDARRAKVIVVQECEETGNPAEIFRQIQDLPGVLAADLACHVVDPDGDGPDADGTPGMHDSGAAPQ